LKAAELEEAASIPRRTTQYTIKGLTGEKFLPIFATFGERGWKPLSGDLMSFSPQWSVPWHLAKLSVSPFVSWYLQ
jgi:hypothetical protein